MTSEAASCVVADDHMIVRDGMRLRLEQWGYRVVGESASGEETLQLLRDLAPSFAIIDYRLEGSDGLEVTRQARVEGITSRLIIYTAEARRATVERAFELGADAYIGKESRREIVVGAIEAVLAGKTFIDPTLAAELLSPSGDALTQKELEVLSLMGEGMSNKVIAHEMDVSIETVKTHVAAIMRKLESGSRTEAVVQGFRRSLLT